MLQEKFRSYVRERSLCTADERILLAVSGGVDSMVMLSLFVRCGYRVGVAHCNFQVRGREADEDDVLVEQQAARYGVPYFGARFDTLAEVAATGDSVEMAARRLRYGWFDKLCDEHGYDKIAIAHHADDSVETFFINLIRGTGLRGLTGIHVVNGRLIRPLLFSTRREIVDYALANKIPYREDSSNASTKYLRNKFRLGIVPRIKEISPQFTETMTSNVERLTSAQSFIDRGIELIRQHAVRTEGDRTVIEMSLIDPLLPLHFVIFELMRGMGFNGEVIDSLGRAFAEGHGSGKRFFSKDSVAYIDRGRIIVTPIPDDESCESLVTPRTERIPCGGGTLWFEHADVDDIDELRQPPTVALLDEAKLSYPLKVRRWSEGDAFVPFGMGGRRKKVSDMLIDDKISLPDKRRQFVVVSGGDIVWLVGRRIDERYAVGSGTENVLRIRILPDDDL